MNIAQPDLTLLLDSNGVIKEVTLSDALAGEAVEGFVGRPWVDTVADLGMDKVRRLIEEAGSNRVSVFRQINQRFPSGLELLMEYTTVRLGEAGGVIAIGRSLQAVAELQARLVSAQQAMERDYWKLREVETRYRLLFKASTEAVLLVKAANLRIVEANPAAVEALGLEPERSAAVVGREFVAEAAAEEREALHAMLLRAREQGKAPGMLVHLGHRRAPWLIRASLMTSEPGPVFLLQLTPAGAALPMMADRGERVSIDELIERAPDGFVAVDREGIILRANRAFLDLAQVAVEESVVGEPLGRWLGRPGADQTVLLSTLHRHGVVRLFSTTIHGELGTDTSVEISAAADVEGSSRHIGVLIRDVGRRLVTSTEGDRLTSVLGSLTEQIGKTSIRKLVEDTVAIVERHYIEAALELTAGNRTAAAELLGLSRQSLYVKLNRYGLDGDEAPPATELQRMER